MPEQTDALSCMGKSLDLNESDIIIEPNFTNDCKLQFRLATKWFDVTNQEGEGESLKQEAEALKAQIITEHQIVERLRSRLTELQNSSDYEDGYAEEEIRTILNEAKPK